MPRSRALLIHLILIIASAVTLYPILWVFKIALTPSQAFDSNPFPFPQVPQPAQARVGPNGPDPRIAGSAYPLLIGRKPPAKERQIGQAGSELLLGIPAGTIWPRASQARLERLQHGAAQRARRR